MLFVRGEDPKKCIDGKNEAVKILVADQIIPVDFVDPDTDKQNEIIAMVGSGEKIDRDLFLKQMKEGQMPDSKIAAVIAEKIDRPVDDEEGWEFVWRDVSLDNQMRGIASVGGRLSVTRDDFNRANFQTFLDKYPTPFEFWKGPGNIKGWLNPKNSPSKFKEYERKALAMAKKVYGEKQQNIFDQVVLMRQEAMKSTPVEDVTTTAVNEVVKEPSPVRVENNVSFDGPVIFSVGDVVGAGAVDIGVGNGYSKNEDFLVILPEKKVFAVVDGAGGGGRGHEAGKITAEKIAEVVEDGDVSVESLQKAQDEAADRIVEDLGRGNGAAVVVAWLEGNVLNTALTGDCRCVVLRKGENGRYETVFTTHDQANLHKLTNAVGKDGGGGVINHETFELQPGDLAAGFSDGVSEGSIHYKSIRGDVDQGRLSLDAAANEIIDEGNRQLANLVNQEKGYPVRFVKRVGQHIKTMVESDNLGGKGDNRSMFAFVFKG
jgi:serine/threonine protein phosphatase PrpC